MNQRTEFLLQCLRKRTFRQGFACPSCGNRSSEIVSRKYGVTTLHRCHRCRLLYRVPTTSTPENEAFYQRAYRQGFTTDTPSEAELDRLLQSKFRGTEKDYGSYVRIFESAGVASGARILDFGCSWGYGAWQLQEAGFRVQAFEISRPRAAFARDRLGVDVKTDLAAIEGPFDVFFSAHVLEHVPSVQEAASFGLKALSDGGLFVAFTPNGSAAYRQKRPRHWNMLWGLVHPNFLDDVYYRHLFPGRPLLLASNPYPLDAIAQWAAQPENREPSILSLEGDELMALVRK